MIIFSFTEFVFGPSPSFFLGVGGGGGGEWGESGSCILGLGSGFRLPWEPEVF